jgi:N-acetylglucosamine kinase-like BadF-type ATPase
MPVPVPRDAMPCSALGADAGGSKVHIRWRDGAVVREKQLPSVNLRRIPVEEAADRLADAVRQSLDGRPLAPDAVCCFGAAGAGTPAVADPLREALAVRLELPISSILVTSDAHIAHRAAFGTHPGLLVIAGTGSGCYTLTPEGGLTRVGGWGPGLGDPGSGSALGKDAVTVLLEDLETGRMSAFSRAIAAAMELEEPTVAAVLDAFYQPDFQPARLAPIILDALEAEDERATQVVERQVFALSQQAQRLASTLSPAPTGIALVGGLTDRDGYMERLRTALASLLPGVTVSRATAPPVQGALEWAEAERKRLSP